jgi:hypothetical protein
MNEGKTAPIMPNRKSIPNLPQSSHFCGFAQAKNKWDAD